MENPNSFDEAVAMVSLNPKLIKMTQALVRKHLGAHIKASNEYYEIAEDAIGSSVERILKIAERKGVHWEMRQEILSSFNTNNCLATKYLTQSIKRYITKRKFFWGVDKQTGAPRFKARQTMPSLKDDDELTKDEWLETLLNQRHQENLNVEEHLEVIKSSLESANIPKDIIDLISMRGEGMTYPEIADKTAQSKDAIRMKLNRVKPSLMLALNE